MRPVINLINLVLAWLSVWSEVQTCMAQLMPLLLTVSCFCKIQIAFTFLVLAHAGSNSDINHFMFTSQVMKLMITG